MSHQSSLIMVTPQLSFLLKFYPPPQFPALHLFVFSYTPFKIINLRLELHVKRTLLDSPFVLHTYFLPSPTCYVPLCHPAWNAAERPPCPLVSGWFSLMWGISWRSESRKSEIFVPLSLWLLPPEQWQVLLPFYSPSSCQSHNRLFRSPLPTCGGKASPCCSTKCTSSPLLPFTSTLTTSCKDPLH